MGPSTWSAANPVGGCRTGIAVPNEPHSIKNASAHGDDRLVVGVSVPTHLACMAWENHDPGTRLADHKARAKAKREERLKVMQERLTTSVDALITGDDWRRAMEFAARFRGRSFKNVLLIQQAMEVAYAEGIVPTPVPTYVAGFRQWQTLGRSVMKGQPGIQILAPVTGRYATATPADADSWRRLRKGERPRPGETAKSKMIGLRPAYVWDITQTDGAPIPTPPTPKLLEGAAPEGLWDALADDITSQGYGLRLVSDARHLGGANGLTDFLTREVSVRTDMDEAAMVRTLAHEAGHVALHTPTDAQENAAKHRGIAEVEAEGVSMMITAAHGMDSSAYTVPYVSTWATQVPGRDPVQVVQDTAARVRTAAIAILDRLDTTQVPDGTPPGLERAVRSTSTDLGPARPMETVSSVERSGL